MPLKLDVDVPFVLRLAEAAEVLKSGRYLKVFAETRFSNKARSPLPRGQRALIFVFPELLVANGATTSFFKNGFLAPRLVESGSGEFN